MALKTLRARSFAQFTLSEQSKILRCAQNDSERARDDGIAAFFRSLFSPAEWNRGSCGPLGPEAKLLQRLKPLISARACGGAEAPALPHDIVPNYKAMCQLDRWPLPAPQCILQDLRQGQGDIFAPRLRNDLNANWQALLGGPAANNGCGIASEI